MEKIEALHRRLEKGYYDPQAEKDMRYLLSLVIKQHEGYRWITKVHSSMYLPDEDFYVDMQRELAPLLDN